MFIRIILLLVFFITGVIAAAAQEKKDDKMEISGLFRTRGWHTASEIFVPGRFPASDSYLSVNYMDLFFRSRIDFAADQFITIKTVFDVSSSMGKGQFAMNKMGTNLVTRNLYAEFRFSDDSVLKAGLMPFSLPGGYILASDATGFTYNRKLFNGMLDLYSAYIKAFDKADSAYGDNMAEPEYTANNIYYAGGKFNPTGEIYSELYGVFEYDRYTDDIDTREAELFWIGSHNRYQSGKMLLSAGFIYNQGSIKNEGISKKNIHAGLAEVEAGYRFDIAELSAAVEGATGDPADPAAKNSFQDIKASRGFSMIAVDNSGGLAVRGGGESPWYGLMGYSIKAKKTLFNIMIMELKLAAFTTTGRPSPDSDRFTRFGEEINLKGDFPIRETGSFFICAAAFLPGGGYREIYNQNKFTPVMEFMAGTQINF